MPLRAVIFDYGMVLTGKPVAAEHDAMLKLTGLPHDRFEQLYWADRHAYDEGKLTGLTFWQKFLATAQIPSTPALVDQLNTHDARMWTTQNPAMLQWHSAVRARGLRTAILSNMGDAVHANMERTFDWLPTFDVLVWSYQLCMAKPDPAIYRHTLQQLGTSAQETLFIDDNHNNILAARALGITAIQFSTVDDLRQQLLTLRLDNELPLP